jgi:O-antigen ligase
MGRVTLNSWERWAAWLALVFLLPVADLIGNLSAYGYAVVLILMLPVLLWDKTMRHRMWRPASLAYLAAFLLLLVAIALSAQAPSDVQYAGNFVFFLFFVPAVALLSANRGPRAAEQFAWLALAGATLAFGWSLYEFYVIGKDRVVGFVNLTNPFAMMAVMLGFLAVTGFFARQDRLRLLFLAGPALGGIAALLAGTRAAVVMAVCLAALFVIFAAIVLPRRERLVVLGAGLAALVLAGVGMLVFSEQVRALSAFQTMAMYFGQGAFVDHSTQVRVELYIGGIQAFLDSPIFGHGWWRHVEAAHPYMSEMAQLHTQRWSHLHNDYINFGALAGVMGLAAYFIYMATPVVGAWRGPRDSQYHPRLFAALVLAGCYAIFGLFDTSFSMEILLGFGPICAAALLGFCVDGDVSGDRAGTTEPPRG